MLIGDLANAAGLPSQTIRFYERKGLLPAPERGANGYRTYDESTLARLRFVQTAQAAGLTLAEIGTIIDLRDDGNVPCAHVATPDRQKAHRCACPHQRPRRARDRTRRPHRTQPPPRSQRLHRRRHLPHHSCPAVAPPLGSRPGRSNRSKAPAPGAILRAGPSLDRARRQVFRGDQAYNSSRQRWRAGLHLGPGDEQQRQGSAGLVVHWKADVRVLTREVQDHGYWSPSPRRPVGDRAWPADASQGVQSAVDRFDRGRRCGLLGPGERDVLWRLPGNRLVR